MTKTRGRPPKEIPKTPEIQFDEAEYRASVAETRGIAQIKASYTAERDQLNQMIGRVQMGLAQAGLSTAINLQNLKSIKESKSYRLMAGEKGVDRRGVPIPDLGTWDGFCRALGCSPDKIDEDLLNFEAFGADALECLTAVGAGYRELRQFRKLPEDRKLEVLEVAKRGDKEGFAELVEEIITKHAAEKAALTSGLQSAEAEADELRAELKASEQVLATKGEAIDRLRRSLRRIEMLEPDKKLDELRKEAVAIAMDAELTILGGVRQSIIAIRNHEHDRDANDVFLAGLVGQIMGKAKALLEEFNLPDVSSAKDQKLLAEMHQWDK